jgi:hypothetical protein
MRILQEQTARRGKSENRAQGSIQSFDLDLAITWKAVRTLQSEGEK